MRKRSDPKNLFWKYCIKGSDSECWIWSGYVQNAGYGSFSTYSKTVLAHRFSYELFKGEIKENMTIDHLCKNKLCVNPNHLEQVTRKENINRSGLSGVAKKSSLVTYCPYGHSYTKYGVVYKNGYTKAGSPKFARRCTKCYPKYIKLITN